VRNASSLLTCALASELLGDLQEAARLERAADRLGIEAPVFVAPRLRLALARRDPVELRRLLRPMPETRGYRLTLGLNTIAARLDALAFLRDQDRIEEEAPRFTGSRNYLEPFALRALGVVREDEELIGQAQERFAALRLDWHAAETQKLLEPH